MDVPGPIFVATAWNCLATISESATFRPLWRPRFFPALVAEDRAEGAALLEGSAPSARSTTTVTTRGKRRTDPTYPR
jgi:hypothetical protein